MLIPLVINLLAKVLAGTVTSKSQTDHSSPTMKSSNSTDFVWRLYFKIAGPWQRTEDVIDLHDTVLTENTIK